MKRRPIKYCRETRRRIRVAVAAYAYEIENDPVMSDAEYDSLCREIDPDMATGNQPLDVFFMVHFEPDTGQWVHKHPDIPGLKRVYDTVFRDREKPTDDWRDLI